MKTALKILAFTAAVLFVLSAAACSSCIYDGPPNEPDSTEPPAHNGVFVSDHGSMTFNGDGRSVVIEIDKELAELTGLPEGRNEGSYSFKANTPPHTYDCRWDMANEFAVTVGDKSFVFGTGGASEIVIPLHLVHDDKVVDLVFSKLKD